MSKSSEIDVQMTDEENRFEHIPLKSQQKEVGLPELQLHIASLENNFLLSAHENIISTFKANKRFIEKELSNLFNSAKKMKKAGKDQPEITINGIDDLLKQIAKTKQSYQEMINLEDSLIRSLSERLIHVQKISTGMKDAKVVKEYMETKLNRIILDWFLQNKQFIVAKTFAREAKINVFSNIDIFIETNNIYQKLKESAQDGSTEQQKQESLDAVISWCNTYKTKLLQNGSTLEFEIRILQFTEYLKQNEHTKSTQYAQQHLQKYFFDMDQNNPKIREQQIIIQQSMGLLAFQAKQRLQYESYKYLTNQQRWVDLQQQFLDEATNLFHIEKNPQLQNCLQVGISCMRTVFCTHNQQSTVAKHQEQKDQTGDAEAIRKESAESSGLQYMPDTMIPIYYSGQGISASPDHNLESPLRLSLSPTKKKMEDDQNLDPLHKELLQSKSRNLDSKCPVCDPLILQLSKNLKFAQQTQTNMKCKITGKLMNHDDPPTWIPFEKQILTEKQKEESKKNSTLAQELKMYKGYLVCKSYYEQLEEITIENKDGFESNKEETKIKCIKCPLTKKPVEKSKIRKVYFC